MDRERELVWLFIVWIEYTRYMNDKLETNRLEGYAETAKPAAVCKVFVVSSTVHIVEKFPR